MSKEAAYKILGLPAGAGRSEIKKAFRRLAKKVHPDLNPDAAAAERFLEISRAYEELMEEQYDPYQRDSSYEAAAEILRNEREKAWARERQRIKVQEEADERFRKSGWYDLMILGRYLLNMILLLGSVAAIVVPIILGFIIRPAAMLSTMYFILIGAFGIWYIYKHRREWFRLGTLNTNWKRLRSLLQRPPSRP